MVNGSRHHLHVPPKAIIRSASDVLGQATQELMVVSRGYEQVRSCPASTAGRTWRWAPCPVCARLIPLPIEHKCDGISEGSL